MKKGMICALLCLLSFHAQAGDGMLVYGKDTAFLLNPPKTWVVDTHVGVEQGINAALYPKGDTWQNAPSVMYVRVSKKNGRRLDQFVADDEKQFQSDCPGIRIQNGTPAFKTEHPTMLRKFDCRDARAPNAEWVAYIDAKKSFIVFVASSRSEDDLAKIQPAYEQVLRDLITMDVTK